MPRVVIYARYSSNLQTDKSIEDQIGLCEEYRRRQSNWNVTEIYSDHALSGTSIYRREGLLRLMDDAQQKKFDIVLTEAIDRLSRNQADTAYFFQCMQFADVGICTVQDGFINEMHVAFKGLEASSFIKNLGQKTRRGQVGTVKRGLMSGSVAYGYRVTRSVEVPSGGREIHPDQSAVVRRIFLDYVAGISPRQIAKALNREGISGAGDSPWRTTTILGCAKRRTGILRNDLYRGVLIWGKNQHRRDPSTGRRVNRPAPESEIIVVERPELRIIDEELWTAAQARLAASSIERLQGRRRPDYLLTGLLFCGLCGQGYIVMDGRTCGCTGRADHGICNNRRRVPRISLEETVLETLSGPLLHPTLIEQYTREYAAELTRQTAEYRDRASSLCAREADLDRKLQRLLAKITAGEAEGAAGTLIMAEMHKLAAELEQVRAQLAATPSPPPKSEPTTTIVDRLRAQVGRLREELSDGSREASRARETLRSLIDRVLVTPHGEPSDNRGGGAVSLRIEGKLAALLELSGGPPDRVVKMGAGTGFEPVTFRL